jgi:DNA-binding XRE family transcriptional regulator
LHGKWASFQDAACLGPVGVAAPPARLFMPQSYAPIDRSVNAQNTAYWGVQKSEQIFMREFGTNLRRARTSRGVTQQKLAELADLNIRTVQKIEAGKINILVATASRLQKALGCPWDELVD